MKTSEEYLKIAIQNWEDGMNCAQSVLSAFSDETGLDSSTSCKITSSFGKGMGGLGEVCGTLTAIFMAAGMVYGHDDPKPTLTTAQLKAANYERIQKIAKSFSHKHGTYLCRELLARPNHEGRSSCTQLINDAVKIFAAMLAEDEAESST